MAKNFSMILSELLAMDTIQGDVLVESLCIDSRQVMNGSLFIAYPGTSSDGRDYISNAQQAGAVAVLYEEQDYTLPESITIPAIPISGLREQTGYIAARFYQNPSDQMQLFAVTGTNGKTTCAYLLSQALEQLGLPTALIGTLGNGRITALEGSGNTTPDVISIHRMLAEWLDQGIKHVCMEVSSHALDQGRINGVELFCSLFTNLSRDHLDYHGSLRDYQIAKQRLFTDFHAELVITNNDDSMGASLIDIANADFIASYGNDGDVQLEEIHLHEKGMDLFIAAQGVEFEVSSSLVGQVNVPNIMLVVAALLALSTDVQKIQEIVATLRPAPGRMELFAAPNKPTVVIDYAHTPDALQKAIQSVRAHVSDQLWCVFGCGGDRDKGKRPLMGETAATLSDHVIITNDNPRSELPENIIDEIKAGIAKDFLNRVTVIEDRAEAIARVVENASQNDWVLVAGKGHETTQHIGEQVLPFSDKQQVQRCLGVAA